MYYRLLFNFPVSSSLLDDDDSVGRKFGLAAELYESF